MRQLNIIEKKKLKKGTCERHQNLSKEGEKSGNMIKNHIKAFQNMKNKSWLSTEN